MVAQGNDNSFNLKDGAYLFDKHSNYTEETMLKSFARFTGDQLDSLSIIRDSEDGRFQIMISLSDVSHKKKRLCYIIDKKIEFLKWREQGSSKYYYKDFEGQDELMLLLSFLLKGTERAR